MLAKVFQVDVAQCQYCKFFGLGSTEGFYKSMSTLKAIVIVASGVVNVHGATVGPRFLDLVSMAIAQNQVLTQFLVEKELLQACHSVSAFLNRFAIRVSARALEYKKTGALRAQCIASYGV